MSRDRKGLPSYLWPFIILTVGVALVLGAAVLYYSVIATGPDLEVDRELTQRGVIHQQIKGETFKLFLQVNQEDQRTGMAGVPSLPRDEGMLFVYDREQPLTFWMKGCLIGLDIIFLKGDGTVESIHSLNPSPDAPDHMLERASSGSDVQYVIEINKGQAAELGLAVGDKLEIDKDAIKLASQ